MVFMIEKMALIQILLDVRQKIRWPLNRWNSGDSEALITFLKPYKQLILEVVFCMVSEVEKSIFDVKTKLPLKSESLHLGKKATLPLESWASDGSETLNFFFEQLSH